MPYLEKIFKNNPVYFWSKSKIIQQNKLHHNYLCWFFFCDKKCCSIELNSPRFEYIFYPLIVCNITPLPNSKIFDFDFGYSRLLDYRSSKTLHRLFKCYFFIFYYVNILYHVDTEITIWRKRH